MDAALSILSFGGRAKLVGSSSRRALHPSDVDIQVTFDADTAARTLRAAIGALVHTKLCRVVDVKAGGYHYTASQAMHSAPHGIPSLETALQADGRVKLDVVAWQETLARYIELSLLVLRERHGKPVGEAAPSHADLAHALQADINEYANENNYWKAMRRLASLRRIQGRAAAAADLDRLGDGPLGALALVISDLRVLEILCDHDPPRATLAIELHGAAERLGRINITQLVPLEHSVVERLERARVALAHGGMGGVHKAAEAAGGVADALDKVLQGVSKVWLHRLENK